MPLNIFMVYHPAPSKGTGNLSGSIMFDSMGKLMKGTYNSLLNVGGTAARAISGMTNQAAYGLGLGVTSTLGNLQSGIASGLSSFPHTTANINGTSLNPYSAVGTGGASIGPAGSPIDLSKLRLPSNVQIGGSPSMGDASTTTSQSGAGGAGYSYDAGTAAISSYLSTLASLAMPQQGLTYYIPSGPDVTGPGGDAYQSYLDTGSGYSPITYEAAPSNYPYGDEGYTEWE